VLLKVINTELQFVFFDSVWATEARPTCRVNEIKHLRDNYMKCGLALILTAHLYLVFGLKFVKPEIVEKILDEVFS
jgi:hypothetical protein